MFHHNQFEKPYNANASWLHLQMDPFILEKALPAIVRQCSIGSVLADSEDNGQPDSEFSPEEAPLSGGIVPQGMVRPPGGQPMMGPGMPPIRLPPGMALRPGMPPIRLPPGMVLPQGMPARMALPPGMPMPPRMALPPGVVLPPGMPMLPGMPMPPAGMLMAGSGDDSQMGQPNGGGGAKSPEEAAQQSAYHKLQVIAQLVLHSVQRGAKGAPKASFFK